MKFRTDYRKAAYKTDSWKIAFKPWFKKDILGLIGNIYPDDANYLKQRNFYRFYLAIYLILLLGYIYT